MPRKSRTDVMRERLGGDWSWDRSTHIWHCDDGIRTICRGETNCQCWVFNSKCKCEPPFILDDGKTQTVVDLEDPKLFKMNGIKTKW